MQLKNCPSPDRHIFTECLEVKLINGIFFLSIQYFQSGWSDFSLTFDPVVNPLCDNKGLVKTLFAFKDIKKKHLKFKKSFCCCL